MNSQMAMNGAAGTRLNMNVVEAAWHRLENMPADLVGGKLLLSEAEICTALPVPVHGRVDQVYVDIGGGLVAVDSKRRGQARVETADIVQLSAYGFILRHGADFSAFRGQVRPYGYLRVERPGYLVDYLKVRLMTDDAVIAVYTRWAAIKNGAGGEVEFRISEKTCKTCLGSVVCLAKGN